jgi:flavin-dependent dehydrogenase
MEQVDAVIVGGGVAGCAVALRLARHGRSVVVLERGRYPREKVCGEGLMPHGVAQLAALGMLGAVLQTGARRFEGIAWHIGDTSAIGRFPEGFGLGVRRRHLDAAFAQRCADTAGVDLRLGASLRSFTTDPAGVTVTTDDGPVRARVIVGADGRGSLVRKQLGLAVTSTASRRYGLRNHFRLAAGRSEGVHVAVYASDRVELYVTPTGPGEVNLAALCAKEDLGGDGLDAALARMIEACPPVATLLDGASPVGEAGLVGPLRREVTGVVADRALLVGDAAGFVDAITGEGMSLALVTAELAADVLHGALTTGRLDRAALAPYASGRARLTRDQTLLTEIILWGIRHRTLARHVVRQLGKHPDLFGRVLAVNSGHAALADLGLRRLATLLGV